MNIGTGHFDGRRQLAPQPTSSWTAPLLGYPNPLVDPALRQLGRWIIEPHIDVERNVEFAFPPLQSS